jgi:hypothetical protein
VSERKREKHREKEERERAGDLAMFLGLSFQTENRRKRSPT